MTATKPKTKLVRVRPWPCAADCDAPECVGPASYVLNFEYPETPGLDTLYLCWPHTKETAERYGWQT